MNRTFSFSVVFAFVCLAVPVMGQTVKYQSVPVSVELVSRTALPETARTYSVAVVKGLDLKTEDVQLNGFERVASGGDIELRIQPSPAQVGKPEPGSFTSSLYYLANNNPTPPAYEVTVYWAALPVTLPATLAVVANGQERRLDAGIKSTLDVGPRPETKSGAIQVSTSRWTLMAQEPCSSPEATVERVKWIHEQMCADVKTLDGRNGPTLTATTGRKRLQEKLDEANAKAAQILTPQFVKYVNQLLEREVSRGPRTLNIGFAMVQKDDRFDAALKAYTGTQADRFTAAIAALRPTMDDKKAKEREKAAALYDIGICQLAAGEYEQALASLALARETNAKQGDGVLGSSGKDLGEAITAVERVAKDLLDRKRNAPAALGASVPSAAGAPPAAAAAPAAKPAAPAAPVAAPAAAGSSKPWTEMTDDEFMVAYMGLIQAAAARQDSAEMQKLGARMMEITQKRAGKK